MTTNKYIARRPNGKLEWIEEPEGMQKWQFQKWKRQVTKDGTILLDFIDDEFKKYKQLINKQMKTSKVKAVTGNGTWESNYGLLYKFEYVMEDGQIVNANHKTQDGNFKVGEEVEYEITNTQYNNGKVKKPEQSFNGGGYQGNSNDNLKGIKIGHALTNAVSLYAALGGEGKPRQEAIKQYAIEIYQLSEELNNEL